MSEMEKPRDLFEVFCRLLEEEIEDYEGEFWEVIKVAPEMFRLFVNLLRDPDVPASCKPIINATIAYFVAPLDVVPEERCGPAGYLDDLFLCAWSLKRLKAQLEPGVLERNWGGEKPLDRIIDEVYERSLDGVWMGKKDILDYVGLSEKERPKPPFSRLAEEP